MSEEPDTGTGKRGNLFALEVCFLAFVALVSVAAFLEALTYKLVSSRTPFVIMAPLLVLLVIHARRLWLGRHGHEVAHRVTRAIRGGNGYFNKVTGISAWMLGLVAAVAVLGHYAGVYLFCVVLMRFLAGESWKLTLAVAAGATFFIFGVFEFLFDIELYRGLVVRFLLGFRDF